MSNALFNQAAAAAAEAGMDQSEATRGFERKIAPAGPTPARFIGYVEVGSHVEQFEGKDKPAAPQVKLRFELNGPAHKNEFEKDGEKRTWNNTIDIDLSLSLNEKAGFYKLFRKMAYGRAEIKSMPQMLGEAFVLTVAHKKSKSTGKEYPVIKVDGEWAVSAPFSTDPMTGETKRYDIAEMTEKGQVLLWDNPSKEMWDSIYIDGSYTKKVGDTEVEVSKNFIQNRCLEATNFPGSPLEALIGGIGDLPTTLDTPAAEEAPAPVTPTETPAPAPSELDPLAGLNL